jgi:hypothetical protein
MLASHTQRRPARDQRGQARAGAQKLNDVNGAWQEMLEVIEYYEQRPVAQKGLQRTDQGSIGARSHVEHLGQGWHDQGRVTKWRERHEGDAVVGICQAGSEVQG